jgi:hypothetical protein
MKCRVILRLAPSRWSPRRRADDTVAAVDPAAQALVRRGEASAKTRKMIAETGGMTKTDA